MKINIRFCLIIMLSFVIANLFTLGVFNSVQALDIDILTLNETKNLSLKRNPQIQDTRRTDTILVFDISGSMDDYDSSGTTKLAAAKHAGIQILNVIDAENDAQVDAGRIGLVSYGSDAYIESELTNDFQLLENIILSMNAFGRTAMADGLQTGIELFSSPFAKRNIILLSDGLPNIGLNSDYSIDIDTIKQQVINLSKNAGRNGICVNTVGLGDPSIGADSIDVEFLTMVANASGCGVFKYAKDAIELANVYVELRHSSTGEILFHKSGEIAQGEELNLGTVRIPENQDLFLFTVNWPGSKLQPVLIDPMGTTIDNTYTGVSISETSSLISYILEDPIPGDWLLKLIGIDVPESLIPYNAILSSRAKIITPVPESSTTEEVVPTPTTGSGGIGIFLLVLAVFGTGLGVYVYTSTIKNKSGKNVVSRSTGAKIRVERGEYREQVINLVDGFVIGRGSLSNLVLKDSSNSRKHCVFRFSNNSWYIQDLGSNSGTKVNGKRIEGMKLKSGDRIEIGNNVFIFISE